MKRLISHSVKFCYEKDRKRSFFLYKNSRFPLVVDPSDFSLYHDAASLFACVGYRARVLGR